MVQFSTSIRILYLLNFNSKDQVVDFFLLRWKKLYCTFKRSKFGLNCFSSVFDLQPARPPPPNLNLIIDNKQRYMEDQISPRALSPQERRLLSPAKDRRSLKMNVALANKEAANRRKRWV